MENRVKIALLIDCDNMSFRNIDDVLKDLSQYGDVIIKRAYGNWRSEGLNGWHSRLTELSIKPIQQIDYTKGKNATDMAIVIDAMELMYLRKAEAFAIVSSDSDFTPLVMKLNEENFKVYGYGRKSTPTPFSNACSVFSFIEVFNKDEKVEEKTDEKKVISTSVKSTEEVTTLEKKVVKRDDVLLQKIIKISKIISPENTFYSIGKIGPYLKEDGIDYKSYGYSTFKEFINATELFNIVVGEDTQTSVKLKDVVLSLNGYKKSRNELLNDNILMKKIISCYNECLKESENKYVSLNSLCNKLKEYGVKQHAYGFINFKSFMKELNIFNLEMINDQFYIKLKTTNEVKDINNKIKDIVISKEIILKEIIPQKDLKIHIDNAINILLEKGFELTTQTLHNELAKKIKYDDYGYENFRILISENSDYEAPEFINTEEGEISNYTYFLKKEPQSNEEIKTVEDIKNEVLKEEIKENLIEEKIKPILNLKEEILQTILKGNKKIEFNVFENELKKYYNQEISFEDIKENLKKINYEIVVKKMVYYVKKIK